MTSASDKLARLRERRAKSEDEKYIEPTMADSKADFSVVHWYDTIRNDPSEENISAAAKFYADAVDDGKQHIVPVGNLETLLQQLPGITFFYQGILVDVQQIRRWLEERQVRLEAKMHNYFMYDDEAKSKYGTLKTTEAAKMAKACDEVVDLGNAIRLMAYHEHNMEALMDAFENIKYVLNHVVTIRKENLQEVWIDPTKETKNN